MELAEGAAGERGYWAAPQSTWNYGRKGEGALQLGPEITPGKSQPFQSPEPGGVKEEDRSLVPHHPLHRRLSGTEKFLLLLLSVSAEPASALNHPQGRNMPMATPKLFL